MRRNIHNDIDKLYNSVCHYRFFQWFHRILSSGGNSIYKDWLKIMTVFYIKLIDISNQQRYIKDEEMLQCPDDVNKSYKISTRGNQRNIFRVLEVTRAALRAVIKIS